MKILLVIFLSLGIATTLLANPEAKAKEICDCLKLAKESNLAKDKNKCQNLREKHVKLLKKGSPKYEKYLNSLSACEREMMGAKEIDPNLNLEEKTKTVCQCFQKSPKNNSMSCFKLQSDYGKTIENLEEKKQFNLSTSSCNP